MKFIHCFDSHTKQILLNKGYKLISENNGICIFENNKREFKEDEVKKCKLSDRMIF